MRAIERRFPGASLYTSPTCLRRGPIHSDQSSVLHSENVPFVASVRSRPSAVSIIAPASVKRYSALLAVCAWPNFGIGFRFAVSRHACSSTS